MIRSIRVAVVLSLVLITRAIAGQPDQSGYYRGTIDKMPIVMVVGFNDDFIGKYRYLRYGPPIWLENAPDARQQIHLTEVNKLTDTRKAVAHIYAMMNDQDQYIGVWNSANGKKTLPLNLEKIASLATYSVNDPNFTVERSIPQFTFKTPFYTTLNRVLSEQTKKEMDAQVSKFRELTHDPKALNETPESTQSVEVLHADETMVSLLYLIYRDDGGAHGNSWYSAVTYALRDGKIVELRPSDMIPKKSQASVMQMLVKELKHRNAEEDWDTSLTKLALNKFDDLVMNPTANGIVVTVNAGARVDNYAAESQCVLLSYAALKDAIPESSPIGSLASVK